jgi:hypothetical protein
MTKLQSCRPLPAVVLALTLSACGGDATAPPASLTLAEVVAQCVVGTIADASTGQVRSGRVDAEDCVPANTQGGRIEGWTIPQSSFGGLTELEVNIDAAFDAVIVVLGPDGTILADSDTDIGGDVGRERFVLQKGLDSAMPQYFIGVFSYPGQPAGDYELQIGPVP